MFSFTSSTFIFAYIPLSVMSWSNCSRFRRLGMCSLQYSSLTCLGINPHTRAKLGLLFNNLYTLSGSQGNPIIVAPIKLFNKAKKHFGLLPPNRNGDFPGAILSGDTPDGGNSSIFASIPLWSLPLLPPPPHILFLSDPSTASGYTHTTDHNTVLQIPGTFPMVNSILPETIPHRLYSADI